MVVQIYIVSSRLVEAGGSKVQGCLLLHKESEVSLGYTRLSQKTKSQKKNYYIFTYSLDNTD